MSAFRKSKTMSWTPRHWAIPMICLAGFATVPATGAWASARVAMVIGNGAYKSAPVLENPTIDAHAVAAALKRLGFEVIEGYDLNSSEMRGKLGEFSTAIREAKVALVYYAGHGVSIDEENYLLPTDLVVRSASELEINGLSVTAIMRQMKREERANVVILDACRDNPFAKDISGFDKKRGVEGGRGLSPIEGGLAKGSLIAFATDPKQSALDGLQGDNSPFTKALLKNIETPGITIDAMMGRVRDDVWSVTAHKQMPWVNTSLVGGDLFLNPVVIAPPVVAGAPAALPLTAPGPDRLTQENKFWESAEKSGLAEDYQVYVDAYPTGIYAQMAKNRISRLTGQVAAIVPQTASLLQKGASSGEPVTTAEPVPMAKPTVTAAELKADIATPASERLLNLNDSSRREIKLRLKVMGFDTGADNAKFDDETRTQIGEWQKSHDMQPTTALSRIQVAALTEQSEAQYQRYLAAQPMVPQSLTPQPAVPQPQHHKNALPVVPQVVVPQASTRSLIKPLPKPVAPIIHYVQPKPVAPVIRYVQPKPVAPVIRYVQPRPAPPVVRLARPRQEAPVYRQAQPRPAPGGGGDAAAAAFVGGVIGGALGGIKW